MRDSAPVEVPPTVTIRDAIRVIDAGGYQIALVVGAERTLLGTVTDGDVRRGILAGRELSEPVTAVMNPRPTTGTLADGRDRILDVMQRRRIHQVPIVDAAGVVLGVEILDELLQPEPVTNPVILLAGGKGTRLRPITEDIPKPLVRVGDRPILERIVETLRDHGFRDLWMAVNYKGHMIQEHFGDGSAFGVSVRYVEETAPLGTAGALGLLPTAPDQTFLVMNGDLLTAVNPRNILAFHDKHGAAATMCVREFDFQVPYGVVDLDGHKFLGVDEKPVQRFFVNAGIYALSPSVLDLVPPGEPLNMTELFERVTGRGDEAAVFPVREYWLDIGQLPDLERARGDVGGLEDAT